MNPEKKAARRKELGTPRKVLARLNQEQWERADAIRVKYGFRSLYELGQYLWACFLRVADPDNDKCGDPVPDEIEMMFGDLSQSERHFEYVKPKRSISNKSLNNNNLKSN